MKALRHQMFGSMRSAAGVRFSLGAAVLFSIVASFGLHPEPADSAAVTASGIAAAADANRVSPHGCLACLNGGAAVTAPIGGEIASSSVSVAAALSPAPAPAARLAGRDLAGRSPPARS